ncbi:MAG: hypothetical protein A2785_02165 [Candidatus Chisholmbacteria bacterium RIFCSPHIGHO2_01_FULL_49_18]|uniref:Uncharacterized protein n=2 Tax=Candidatus Chisholmiibacteriota TaxID=1817900 RepID=A0A1G1VNE3_9BACT|nr:MAG: hypothetical protein A2785_02165 [Candidatus Chisholmbacteria bacterium RIFCSPHIGHO2_01_FULL_49_18]OGY21525.1 MAG: hypothetical protein A3A65_05375 [Candidatus Chisholmbacteria bacterium RIFCSPLOWO2_01_FULL_49_14]
MTARAQVSLSSRLVSYLLLIIMLSVVGSLLLWYFFPLTVRKPLAVGMEVPIYDTPANQPAMFQIEEFPSWKNEYTLRGTFIPLVPTDAEDLRVELLQRTEGGGTIVFGFGSIDIDTEFDDCQFAIHFTLNGTAETRWWRECTHLVGNEEVRANRIIVRQGEEAWTRPIRTLTKTGREQFQGFASSWFSTLLFPEPEAER